MITGTKTPVDEIDHGRIKYDDDDNDGMKMDIHGEYKEYVRKIC